MRSVVTLTFDVQISLLWDCFGKNVDFMRVGCPMVRVLGFRIAVYDAWSVYVTHTTV